MEFRTLHEFETPLDTEAQETKTMIQKAVDDAKNTGRHPIMMMLLTERQGERMKLLSRCGWRQTTGAKLGELGVEGKEMMLEIVELVYRKGANTRRGWFVSMKAEDHLSLTAEEKDALSEVMKTAVASRFD